MSFKTCLWWEWKSGSSERAGDSHQKDALDPNSCVNANAPAEAPSVHASPWSQEPARWHQSWSEIKSLCSISFKWGLSVPLDWGRRVEKTVIISKFWETSFYWQKKKKSLSCSKLKQSPKYLSPEPWSRKSCVCTHTTNNSEQNKGNKTENDLVGSKKGEWKSPHFPSISGLKFL